MFHPKTLARKGLTEERSQEAIPGDITKWVTRRTRRSWSALLKWRKKMLMTVTRKRWQVTMGSARYLHTSWIESDHQSTFHGLTTATMSLSLNNSLLYSLRLLQVALPQIGSGVAISLFSISEYISWWSKMLIYCFLVDLIVKNGRIRLSVSTASRTYELSE